MSSHAASGILPGEITIGTARAALSYVFADLDWSLRFETTDPLALDIDAGYAFDDCIAGLASTDYPTYTRARLAVRVQDLAAAVDERRLRHLGFDVELLRSSAKRQDAALVRIRENIKNTIRSEIDDQYDRRLPTWADRMERALTQVDEETRSVIAGHVGLDQRVEMKALGKAIKYVFGTLGLRIAPYGSSAVVLGASHRLSDIRKDVTAPAERERANSLVLRAVDALIGERGLADEMEPGDALAAIRKEFEALIAKDGCLGLIDIVKRAAWRADAEAVPKVSCTVLSSLMEEQRHRMNLDELRQIA